MEYWGIGVLERWNVGLNRIFGIGVIGCVDTVGFANDQRFGPSTEIPFPFQRFNQP